MRAPKIEVSRKELGTLMADIQQGRLRVPRFQREFVWERSRILKLLDSMIAEYPIGTIFLWNAPPEYNHLLRDIEGLEQPALQDYQNYQLILDGQQRLTSLYVVINGLEFEGIDYRKIVVDLAISGQDESPFRYRNPDMIRWVPVSELLSGSFAIYESLPSAEYRQRFSDLSDALSRYPFSVVTVSDMQIEDAIEIFERINQQGRKLSRYDLVCASVMDENFDLRERSQIDIVDRLKEGFGEIQEASIPQALALNAKGNTEHKAQLDLTSQQVQSIWQRTVECFRRSVDFVKGNVGAARVDFLPYDAILPVLNFYFYRTGSLGIKSPGHREQLERWFWRTAFAERYSGASQTRMNEDARWIRRLLKENEPYQRLPIVDEERLVSARMSTRSAIRNGVLCLLNTMRPLDFKSREPIRLESDHFSKFTRAERHHIFPAGFLKTKGLASKQVHSIPNFCFIPRDTNLWIGDRPPSEYFLDLRNSYNNDHAFEAVMWTHLIPVGPDSGVWSDNYELFLKQRARLLMEEIKLRCGITTSLRPERRDPVVNRIEVALRDTIHHTLLANGANYWKHSIPGNVQKRVKDSVRRHVHKTPGATHSQFNDPRRRLDYCDVSDYSRIIVNKKNWSLFAPIFKSKPDSEHYLNDFRAFRAALKHNHEIDDLQDHKAQAAILWLRNALQLDLSEFGL